MGRLLKSIHQKMPWYYPVRTWLKKRKQNQEVVQWKADGCPAPPPHIIKQNVLREHAAKFGLATLVETGTYKGDMVEAMKKDFQKVYSIELSQQLFEEATRRFQPDANVEIVQGDSGKQIEQLVQKFTEPVLFWLDGHYSAGATARADKDTPVCEELNHILGGSDLDHVIIIDDAILFGTDPAYPTMQEVEDQVKQHRQGWSISVDTDSIRITP